MTSQSVEPVEAAAATSARNTKERVLVFIVTFLGLLILAGLAAILIKIIYLSSAPPAQPAAADVAGAVALAGDRLDLPAGAVVKTVAVGGDRLAVHYEAPGAPGIVVVDIATGSVLRRLTVVPGGAAR